MHLLLLLVLVGVHHDWLSDLSVRAIRSGHLHLLAVGVGLLHLHLLAVLRLSTELLLHWHSVGVHLGHGSGVGGSDTTGWGSMEVVVVANIDGVVRVRSLVLVLLSAASEAEVDGTTDES